MGNQTIKCTMCGADGHVGCEHGLGAYRPLAYFVAKAIEEHPEKSDRAIAEEIGVSKSRVNELRNELSGNRTVDAAPEKRVGRDGKARKMPKRTITRKATSDELISAGLKPTGEGRVRLDTGEVVGKTAATRLETIAETQRTFPDLQAENDALHEKVARLEHDLLHSPSFDDLRRMDACANHVQRIVTDIDTYHLIRRCLHPDGRANVSSELLHKAWAALHHMEIITWDKKTAPAPLPKTLNELLARRYNAMTRKKGATQ